MSPAGQILIVPFHSKGHTFPATELSLRLASRGLTVTLFLPSQPSSPLHANINVVFFSGPPPPPPAAKPDFSSTSPFPPPPPHLHEDTSLEDYLSKRSDESRASSPYSSSSSSPPPLLCAVVDVMMSRCIETCNRHGVPVVSFFTSSACAAALEHAASKLSLEDLGAAGTVAVPGLPEDMPLIASDLIPEPPPPGPRPSSGPFNASPRLPLEGCGCPPPPLFGWGHSGSPPPPFPLGHPGGPPPHVAPGHVGGPPPPPRPGSHHHHPGGLLRPFRPQPPPPPPPPPHGPGASPPPPTTPPPTHPPSPPPRPSEPGTTEGATSAPAPKSGGRGAGPPRGLGETGAAAALLFNTCDELERPFLDYLAKEAGKPVWGVGPLLPAMFWSPTDGTISDEAARPDPQQQGTTVAEGEVRAWLDSKPPASVLYISFGTLVGPSTEELAELAAALVESDRPFIWVLQTDDMHTGGYFPEDLARRARESHRGLVIRGWAPQLAILSHPSTAAFLSHCGWNSTVEALARGVPVLAWPVKGDQISNARLVTDRLRVGYPVRSAPASRDAGVKKEDVAKGIERLMADEGVRARARAVRSIFAPGFPGSSAASIDAYVDFAAQRFKEASS